MRKNFRHLKPCLKRDLKRLESAFQMTKTRVFMLFFQKASKKNPEPVGVFLSRFAGSTDHQKILIG